MTQANEQPSTAGNSTAALGRASALMASGTLVSRILGLVRTAMLAGILGATGLLIDAWTTANTLPNTIYILLAGGILNTVFVPQITRSLAREDKGRDLTDRLITLTLAALLGVTIIVTAGAYWVTKLYALRWDGDQLALAVAFAYLCLPQVFFYGLYSVLGQVLNAQEKFGWFMWAPVINNVVSIAGLGIFIAKFGEGLTAREWTTEMTWWLAGTATLGVICQALVLIPPVVMSGFRYRPRWGFRGVGLGAASNMALWTLAIIGISQLGLLASTNLMNAVAISAQQDGMPVPGRGAYDFAFLMFILPHSLVATSLLTAMFPALSRAAAADDKASLARQYAHGLRLLATAMVPISVALVVLAPQLSSLLLLFSDLRDTRAVGDILRVLVIGLVPYSIYLLSQRIFHAYQEGKPPFMLQIMITSVMTVMLSIALLLPPQFTAVLVGLGQSLGQTVAAIFAVIWVRRRMDNPPLPGVRSTYVGAVSASLIAVVPLLLFTVFGMRLLDDVMPPKFANLVILAIGGTLFMLLYGVLAHRFGVRELSEVLGPFLRRLPGGRKVKVPAAGSGRHTPDAAVEQELIEAEDDSPAGKPEHNDDTVHLPRPVLDGPGSRPSSRLSDRPTPDPADTGNDTKDNGADPDSGDDFDGEPEFGGDYGIVNPTGGIASYGGAGQDVPFVPATPDSDTGTVPLVWRPEEVSTRLREESRVHGIDTGTVLGERYVLEDLLAQRDDSLHYWSANDQTLDRLVAITVLPATGEFEEMAQSVLDGARRTAAVDDPRLVRVLDVGIENDVCYIVEEGLTDAAALSTLVAGAPLPPEEARRIVGEAASALESARRRGLHHLYLNPYAVLRTGDGSIKVSGVGVAAAIEQAEDVSAIEASQIDTNDLIALLYTGLTGQWPGEEIEGLTPADPLADNSLRSPSEIAGGIPGDLDALCRAAFGSEVRAEQLPKTPGALAHQIGPWPSEVVAGVGEVLPPQGWGAVPADDEDSEDHTIVVTPVSMEDAQTAKAPEQETEPSSDDEFGSDDDQRGMSGGAVAGAAGAAGVGALAASDSAAAEPAGSSADSTADQDGTNVGAGGAVEDSEDYDGDDVAGLGALGNDEPTDDRKKSGLVLALIAAILIVVMIVVFGLIRGLTGGSDDEPSDNASDTAAATAEPGEEPAEETTAAETDAEPEPIDIVGITSYDPEGDDDERNDIVDLAVDGDTTTAWNSHTYLAANWGNLKSGVGLAIDLGESQDVSSVNIDFPEGDYGIEVYVTDEVNREDGTLIGTLDDASGDTIVEADEPVSGQYVLIWFDRAWAGPSGEIVYVSEVTVQ
ncbi:murein biosynthesis integral membrane protein MurJ [Ornithinimicrobium sp. Arc0846-15]|nr:murein biosynthesis integral membrane protein MurJ [Ornithinimicrobium laminariae]